MGKGTLLFVPRASAIGTGLSRGGLSLFHVASAAAAQLQLKVLFLAHSSGWQIGQGLQLGLKIGVPLFLSRGCLGFPTACLWSSKSKCQNKNKKNRTHKVWAQRLS